MVDGIAEALNRVWPLEKYPGYQCQGLTFEEMGRVLGAPASTLKSRFALALSRLRVRLKQRGWSPEETP